MGTKAIEAKQQVVAEIADRLGRAKSVVVADYRGLTVAEVTELRNRLREAGVEYKVLKNTLTRRAAEQVGLQGLDDLLSGPNAFAFGYDDPVAPAKILNEFARTHKALELKGGVVEGRVIGQKEVVDLAQLPSREGLLAMLLSVLQAPIRNFAYAVKQIAEQREGAEAPAAAE
ncbi:MAG: 50S ribosomal protein L10 [Thermoflavifilum sp.]|nr:50S ribosomal protein L10 [Thermoflavifilum sp.]MCL6513558.1 50S ribosomal protein L10 [Alicyclobacillus sp.]